MRTHVVLPYKNKLGEQRWSIYYRLFSLFGFSYMIKSGDPKWSWTSEEEAEKSAILLNHEETAKARYSPQLFKVKSNKK